MPNYLGALSLFGDVGDVGRHKHHKHHGHHGGSASGNAMSAASARANAAAELVRPDMPGAPARDAAMIPGAFTPMTFVLATGLNSLTSTMNPQTAYRVQRSIALVLRNGASAALTAPLIQFLQVGMKPIIATPGAGVALESFFAAQSFDANMMWPPTWPGVVYSMLVNLPVALTTTDSIFVVVNTMGSAVL